MGRAALMSFIFNDEKSCNEAIKEIKTYVDNYSTISLAEIAEIAKKCDADCADIKMNLGYENKVGFDHMVMPTLAPGRQQTTNGYCWFITYDSHWERYL